MKKTLILLSILLISCVKEKEKCPNYNYQDITYEEIKADRYTPNGVGLDDPINPEHRLDASRLDSVIDKFEQCINENLALNPVIEEPEGHCLIWEFPEGIKVPRQCITVKVPDTLYQSKCSEEWLFPCDMDPYYCIMKGIEPTDECPCHCRAQQQDGINIITNHVLNVFLYELARIVTSCNRPWLVPQFKNCLSP